jgi:hypothetical protein
MIANSLKRNTFYSISIVIRLSNQFFIYSLDDKLLQVEDHPSCALAGMHCGSGYDGLM